MPRSALLCLKIEIWAVTDHLGLELECSRRKNRAAAKKNFATAHSFGGDGELLSAYSFSSSRSSFRKAHVECSIPCWSARWPCTPESPPPVGFDGIHPGFLARHPFKSPFAPISRIAVGQLFEIWEFYLILEGGWVGGWLLSGYEKKVCSRQGE